VQRALDRLSVQWVAEHRRSVVRARQDALDQEFRVAAPGVRVVLAGGVGDRTDHRGEHRQIAVVEAGADDAGGLGTADDRGDLPFEPVALLHDGRTGLARTDDGVGECSVARSEREDAHQVDPERLTRVGHVRGARCGVVHGLELGGEQRLDQGVLVGEPAVDGADPDAGLVRDVVQRDREPALREALARRLQDQLAVARRVGAQRSLEVGRGLGGAHDPTVVALSGNKWMPSFRFGLH
jgi:hypothetical protein